MAVVRTLEVEDVASEMQRHGLCCTPAHQWLDTVRGRGERAPPAQAHGDPIAYELTIVCRLAHEVQIFLTQLRLEELPRG